MAVDDVKRHLAEFGLDGRVREFDTSSATVELAAQAVGTGAPAASPRRCRSSWTGAPSSSSPQETHASTTRNSRPSSTRKRRCSRRIRRSRWLGHAVGGVCPFALPPDVSVYLDESLRRFDTVFPRRRQRRQRRRADLRGVGTLLLELRGMDRYLQRMAGAGAGRSAGQRLTGSAATASRRRTNVQKHEKSAIGSRRAGMRGDPEKGRIRGARRPRGDEGYPYAVPLNYVFVDGAIYFHSAKEGHKIDAITREAKASFCVVDKSAVVPELFATAYKSVIAFGRVRIVEEQEERNRALIALVEALSPHVAQESKHAEIDSCRLNDSVAVLAVRSGAHHRQTRKLRADRLARNSSAFPRSDPIESGTDIPPRRLYQGVGHLPFEKAEHEAYERDQGQAGFDAAFGKRDAAAPFTAYKQTAPSEERARPARIEWIRCPIQSERRAHEEQAQRDLLDKPQSHGAPSRWRHCSPPPSPSRSQDASASPIRTRSPARRRRPHPKPRSSPLKRRNSPARSPASSGARSPALIVKDAASGEIMREVTDQGEIEQAFAPPLGRERPRLGAGGTLPNASSSSGSPRRRKPDRAPAASKRSRSSRRPPTRARPS